MKMKLPMIGRKAIKRFGYPRKKKVKQAEKSEWRKDFDDEQIYPELEEDDVS